MMPGLDEAGLLLGDDRQRPSALMRRSTKTRPVRRLKAFNEPDQQIEQTVLSHTAGPARRRSAWIGDDLVSEATSMYSSKVQQCPRYSALSSGVRPHSARLNSTERYPCLHFASKGLRVRVPLAPPLHGRRRWEGCLPRYPASPCYLPDTGAGNRVCVRRVILRPGDDPREQLEAVYETGPGRTTYGPDLVVPTDRGRHQLGEHGTGLLGGPSEVVAGASKWVSRYIATSLKIRRRDPVGITRARIGPIA
jgi:hypothetical protein